MGRLAVGQERVGRARGGLMGEERGREEEGASWATEQRATAGKSGRRGSEGQLGHAKRRKERAKKKKTVGLRARNERGGFLFFPHPFLFLF